MGTNPDMLTTVEFPDGLEDEFIRTCNQTVPGGQSLPNHHVSSNNSSFLPQTNQQTRKFLVLEIPLDDKDLLANPVMRYWNDKTQVSLTDKDILKNKTGTIEGPLTLLKGMVSYEVVDKIVLEQETTENVKPTKKFPSLTLPAIKRSKLLPSDDNYGGFVSQENYFANVSINPNNSMADDHGSVLLSTTPKNIEPTQFETHGFHGNQPFVDPRQSWNTFFPSIAMNVNSFHPQEYIPMQYMQPPANCSFSKSAEKSQYSLGHGNNTLTQVIQRSDEYSNKELNGMSRSIPHNKKDEPTKSRKRPSAYDTAENEQKKKNTEAYVKKDVEATRFAAVYLFVMRALISVEPSPTTTPVFPTKHKKRLDDIARRLDNESKPIQKTTAINTYRIRQRFRAKYLSKLVDLFEDIYVKQNCVCTPEQKEILLDLDEMEKYILGYEPQENGIINTFRTEKYLESFINPDVPRFNVTLEKLEEHVKKNKSTKREVDTAKLNRLISIQNSVRPPQMSQENYWYEQII